MGNINNPITTSRLVKKKFMELNFNIFISHDNKDEAVAIEIKNFLENIFLNSKVYVSGRDLQGGQTWIENIKLSLKTAQVVVALITKESIKNHWVYFEIGAGFIEDKSIPLLADNLEFSDLEPPLSLLQARTLSKVGIEGLVTDIAHKVNLRVPKTLSGLDKLLNESDNFFSLRKSESVNKSVEKVAVKTEVKDYKSEHSDVDKEIKTAYDSTRQRMIDLYRKKILTYKTKLDLPTEDEINGMDLNELDGLAKAYNIPSASWAHTKLIIFSMGFPKSTSKKWEKMNATKSIEDINIELDRYEKSI